MPHGGVLGIEVKRFRRLLHVYGARKYARFVAQGVCSEYLKRLRLGHQTFKVDGRIYNYEPPHGINERIVEIPFVSAFLLNHATQGARILEVGNVLKKSIHYSRVILDKYERGPGIVNGDAADFSPKLPFDLIASISTLEHVGWDEPSQDPSRSKRTFENLFYNCLADGGHMIVSVPLGYNPKVDELFMSDPLGTGRRVFLKRVSSFNEWIQVPFDDRWRSEGFPRYSSRYMSANLLAFWEATKALTTAEKSQRVNDPGEEDDESRLGSHFQTSPS